MRAVILVGGEGTRLRPLTFDTPKPLIPVANRPFLEHVLARLSRHGVTEAILTTGYLAEAFEAFPDALTHGVKLTIVREERPLGTCGAVRNVAELLDDTFFVLNGDILTDVDLSEMLRVHRERNAVGTLALSRVRDPSAYGLVPIDGEGRIEQFIEKPRADESLKTDLINAGTYILEPDALAGVPAGETWSFERQLFPGLLSDGAPLFGFPSQAYWLDLGTPQKYLRANVDVLEGKVGEPPPGERSAAGVWTDTGADIDPTVRLRGPAAIGPDCRVAEGAVIYPLTCIGPDCEIGAGAVIEESVLHEGVVVDPKAVVERSVLAGGVYIGAGSRVADAIIGPGVRVGAENELRSGIRLWPGLEIPDGSIRF